MRRSVPVPKTSNSERLITPGPGELHWDLFGLFIWLGWVSCIFKICQIIILTEGKQPYCFLAHKPSEPETLENKVWSDFPSKYSVRGQQAGSWPQERGTPAWGSLTPKTRFIQGMQPVNSTRSPWPVRLLFHSGVCKLSVSARILRGPERPRPPLFTKKRRNVNTGI